MQLEIDKHQVIELHHQLLLGTFFSKVELNADYIRVHTNVQDELYWQYVLPFNEKYCIANDENIYTRVNLETPNHQLLLNDSWMVYFLDRNRPDLPLVSDRSHSFAYHKELDLYQFIEVNTKEEMEQFLEGFLHAYSGFYPEDPYGALSKAYYPALFSSFLNKQTKLQYFYALNEANQIVGTLALAIYPPYCFVYCVGITPPFRKMGLGKMLLDFQKDYAERQNCSFLIIQTEKDSFVEHFYSKNGFKELTRMYYYQSLIAST